MVLSGAAKERLLVFSMELSFIFTAQLSLLLLGHSRDSTEGSNIRYAGMDHWQDY